MTETLSKRSSADDVLAGQDLSGRAMLVTGANSGIGFETARALAARCAHVFVACRTEANANSAVAAIRGRHPTSILTPVEMDLASFTSVRRAVPSVSVPALHAVICNAGLFASHFDTTADGIERTVGVCHFGHFLLVSLLLDKLRAAAPARVVMVSSESHRTPAVLRFDRVPLGRERDSGVVSYGQAKLCNVLFANELTRRFRGEGITSNSLHPGAFIGTSIFRDTTAGWLIMQALRPFTKTVPQGAATTVYCAAHPAVEGVGGRYFVDCREKPASPCARDEAVAKRLWELSEERVR
jgi:WW domain-containing oxidoreductase